jgi:hypothetical protein
VLGLSPPEIAERLGKTESSVHGLHHRGRASLKAALSEREASPASNGHSHPSANGLLGGVPVAGLGGADVADSPLTLLERARGTLAGILGRAEASEASATALQGATTGSGAIATGGILAKLSLGGAGKLVVSSLGSAAAVTAGLMPGLSAPLDGSAIANPPARMNEIAASGLYRPAHSAPRRAGGGSDAAGSPIEALPAPAPEELTAASPAAPDLSPTTADPPKPLPAVEPPPPEPAPEEPPPPEPVQPPPPEPAEPPPPEAAQPPSPNVDLVGEP